MKIFTLLLFGMLMLSTSAWSQETDKKETRLIFVRHAEKVDDGSRDPSLSSTGKNRATQLARLLLDEFEVSAIYSTPYKRTRETSQPIADSLNIEIQEYGLDNPSELLETIIALHPGGDVLIVGHSNTTPDFVNRVLERDLFQQLSEKDYGDLFIVTLSNSGEKTIELRSF